MPRTASGRTQKIDAGTARRLLLGAQGLLHDPARPVDARGVFDLIQRIGFVQIDTINTLERAHHLTLFSRMDHYRPEMLRTLLEDSRDLFEHWTHDASAIPTKWFAHWRHRFERYRRNDPKHAWWKARLGPRPRAIINEVLKRIDTEGPLMSRDFERPRTKGPAASDAWWQWRPHKAALEHLWRCGELTILRRTNFQKVYDRTERVLHDHHHLPASDHQEHVEWACRSAFERLVVATPREIAGFWNAVDLATARTWCARAKFSGDLVEVTVEHEGDGPPMKSLALPDWQDRAEAMPDPPARLRLLSPFDPVIRDRARALRLFDFDYRFEAFTPAPKRKYGYYVLPMLEGDRFIGRVDASHDRAARELVINGQWLEPGVKTTPARRRAISDAIQRLAGFISARQVVSRDTSFNHR